MKTKRKNSLHQSSIHWKIPQVCPIWDSSELFCLALQTLFNLEVNALLLRQPWGKLEKSVQNYLVSEFCFVGTWDGIRGKFCWCRKVQILSLHWQVAGGSLPISAAREQAGFSSKRNTEFQQWNDHWGKTLPAAIHPPFTCTLWATTWPLFETEGHFFLVNLCQVPELDFCSCRSFKGKIWGRWREQDQVFSCLSNSFLSLLFSCIPKCFCCPVKLRH